MTDFHERAVKAWDTRGRGRASESEELGTWSPEGKWTPNDSAAAREWGKHEGVKPGDVPVPFPVWRPEERVGFDPQARDWWHGKRPINEKEPVAKATKSEPDPQMIDVSDLIATQHVVTEASVARNVARVKAGIYPHGMPVIVRVGNKSFIYDGHHRCAAAKVSGEGKILAHVFVASERSPARIVTRAHGLT